jgi:predicted nucleic acid-binding Zn ribbon protein
MIQKPAGDKSLKDAMDEMLHEFHLDKKLSQQKLLASWEKIMGKAVANRTSKLFFHDKKLFIYLDSAALRQELLNSRDKIKALLNEEAGTEIVEEIILQ